MVFDANKNNPKMLDLDRLSKGLSKEQLAKINYEADLLRMGMETLMKVAPFLFNEGVTAANTKVIKVQEKEPKFYYPDANDDTFDSPDYSGYI